MQRQKTAAVILAALLAAVVCSAQNVVDELSSCPTNTSAYPQADLGASLSSWLNQTITANGTNCTTALVALTSCSNDNSGNSSSNSSTPGLTSLQIQQGCCSSACAKAVEKALVLSGPGCYRTFLGAVCDNAQYNATLAEPLLGLTQRCMGINTTCASLSEEGSLLPADLEALAVNATSGTAAGANGSTGSDAVNITSSPRPILSVPAPDPYKLMPQESPPPSDTLLATPDEIASDVASDTESVVQGGGAGRRLAGHALPRRQASRAGQGR